MNFIKEHYMQKTAKKETLFSRDFILTSLSTFTLFASFYFLLITLPIYIQKIGGTESEIGLIIGVFYHIGSGTSTVHRAGG